MDLRWRKFGQAGGESSSGGHLLQAHSSWEQAASGPAVVTAWLGVARGSAGPRGAAWGLQSPPLPSEGPVHAHRAWSLKPGPGNTRGESPGLSPCGQPSRGQSWLWTSPLGPGQSSPGPGWARCPAGSPARVPDLPSPAAAGGRPGKRPAGGRRGVPVVLGPPRPSRALPVHGLDSSMVPARLAAPPAWGTSLLQPGSGSLPLPLGHLTISFVASLLFLYHVTTSLLRISLS